MFNLKRLRSFSLLTFFAAALFFVLNIPSLFAYGEVAIGDISAESRTPNRYVLHGTVTNVVGDPREVILRAQIAFYDRTAPAGDLPLSVLRKDLTLILKSGESRKVTISMFREGTSMKGAIRMVPSIRVRRQREWNY